MKQTTLLSWWADGQASAIGHRRCLSYCLKMICASWMQSWDDQVSQQQHLMQKLCHHSTIVNRRCFCSWCFKCYVSLGSTFDPSAKWWRNRCSFLLFGSCFRERNTVGMPGVVKQNWCPRYCNYGIWSDYCVMPCAKGGGQCQKNLVQMHITVTFLILEPR